MHVVGCRCIRRMTPLRPARPLAATLLLVTAATAWAARTGKEKRVEFKSVPLGTFCPKNGPEASSSLGPTKPANFDDYGQDAFLLAGSETYLLAGAANGMDLLCRTTIFARRGLSR
jgi:hypothetical protein